MTDKPRKIDCDEAVRLLFTYLDGELGEHDHHAVQTHLDSCRACFSHAEFEKRLRSMVKGAPSESAPDELRRRIRKLTDSF